MSIVSRNLQTCGHEHQNGRKFLLKSTHQWRHMWQQTWLHMATCDFARLETLCTGLLFIRRNQSWWEDHYISISFLKMISLNETFHLADIWLKFEWFSKVFPVLQYLIQNWQIKNQCLIFFYKSTNVLLCSLIRAINYVELYKLHNTVLRLDWIVLTYK